MAQLQRYWKVRKPPGGGGGGLSCDMNQGKTRPLLYTSDTAAALLVDAHRYVAGGKGWGGRQEGEAVGREAGAARLACAERLAK